MMIFFCKRNAKKKNLFGVSAQVKIGLKKKPLAKINLFLEKALFEQTPQNSKKKWVQSLNNRN